jgi:hypothetical protein
MSQYQQNNDWSEDVSQVEAAGRQIDDEPSVRIEEMREFQLEMIDAAQANAALAFDFARELAAAKTPSELMDLCMTHAQKQMATAAETAEQTTDLDPKMITQSVYIEARPKQRQEQDPIDDFVVEDDAGQVLGTFDTQMEAIVWAKDAGHAAQVARGCSGNDKQNPDHWRSF